MELLARIVIATTPGSTTKEPRITMPTPFPRRCLAWLLIAPLASLGSAFPIQAKPLRCQGSELVSLLQIHPRPLLELRYASPL